MICSGTVLFLWKLQNQLLGLFSSLGDSTEPHCVASSEKKIRHRREHEENSLFGRIRFRTELDCACINTYPLLAFP